MAQGMWSTCPRCGFWQWAGVNLVNVTLVGGSMKVAVSCRWCGRDYDAAGGRDGTYSTVNGRLRLVEAVRTGVRQALSDAPSKRDLAQLAGALAASPGDARAIGDAVARLQTFPRFEAWVRDNPAAAKLAAGILAILFTALATRWIVQGSDPPPAPQPAVEVTVDEPSDEELNQLIDDAIERRERSRAELPDQAP